MLPSHFSIFKFFLIAVLLVLCGNSLRSQWIADSVIDNQIQRGIDYLYNLEFEDADREFGQVIEQRLDHPAGYFFQAMTLWWRILINLDDESKDVRFYSMLEQVIDMCDKRLDQNPKDVTALFFKGGAIGFRGRLRANRGSWLKAVKDGVFALPIVRTAFELDPGNYDVLLGIGIYNYYAEVIPDNYPLVKPLMIFFPKGDRKKGIDQLRHAALQAKYARVEAEYFLMQNYFYYEKEYTPALQLAQDLHFKYPCNPVFHRFLGRCQVRLGYWAEAFKSFTEVEERYRNRQLGYEMADGREAYYYIGKWYFMAGKYGESLKNFFECDELSRTLDKEGPSGFMSMANLYIGMIYDLQQKRDQAIAQYEKVLKMKEFESSHKEARKYLQQPFRTN